MSKTWGTADESHHWTTPIPADGRLLLRVRKAQQERIQAAVFVRISRETSHDETAQVRSRRFIPGAGDSRTLRGIPAIGRNVGGAMAGTRPDQLG